MRLLKLLGLICLCSFLFATGALVLDGLNDRVIKADLIIVPGNTIAANGTPSPRLQARLDEALKVFREHRAPLIFVSGGIGREGFDEAVSMSNYLVKNGVPPTAIVKDSLGVDTFATAKNAADFMRLHNLKSAFVATQYFHVPRLKLALERNGISEIGNAHAHYFEMRDLYSIPRETVGYVVYFVKS